MTNSLFDLPFEEPQEPDADRDSGSGVREPIAPEPRRVFSVSQLTDRIRSLLEERFFEIWVEGEISNCFVAKTGHMYFTLKDTQAQIKAVMFRSAIRYLRFKPQDGLRVVARGRLTVFRQSSRSGGQRSKGCRFSSNLHSSIGAGRSSSGKHPGRSDPPGR